MKPPTVFLGELTNPELEAFLEQHRTVIVPIGSTEQHGPHGPLLTDVLVPQEVARRIATRVGALVAPTINYGMFLNTVLEFLIVAFVIFLMVRQLNRLKTPAPAPPTEDARDCPFCISRISSKAKRCPHCTSELGAAPA